MPRPLAARLDLQNRAFILLIVIVTVAFFWVVRDFWQPVFWASVLAILFARLQQGMTDLLGGRNVIAAIVSLIIIVAVLILPLILVGVVVTREATGIYEQVVAGGVDMDEAVRQAEQVLPAVSQFAERFNIDVQRIEDSMSGMALSVSQYVAGQAWAVGQAGLRFLLMLAIMLYVLFFLLRDGPRIMEGLIRALPLGDVREQRLFSRFASITRATVKGNFVVGLVQGGLGGIAFAALGIGAPVLWGVVMVFFALLPAIGPALVWIPVSIYLLAIGEITRGIILIVFGTLVVGTIDNVLRPILVGRDTRMPDYLILLSTLGGLTLFGLSGLVIGPIFAGLFLTVWEMFVEEYGADQDADEVMEVAAEEGDQSPSAAEQDSRVGDDVPVQVEVTNPDDIRTSSKRDDSRRRP
ncbi:AI-2E family transporter [soil metagenome]